MKAKAALAAYAAAIATAAGAQVLPQVGPGDPRLQTVEYSQDQVVQVRAAPGFQVTVELNSDERIENVAVGDSSAWQVSANRRGDHLFVKPLQGGVATNMTVVTSVRLYAFDLVPGGAGDMPYSLRFRYPGQGQAAVSAEEAALTAGRYRVRGARALQPSAISDDGHRTYIEWPPEVALPAVYAVNARGQEELANGNMRDGVYVIDSVAARLIFRIDSDFARAVRVRGGAR